MENDKASKVIGCIGISGSMLIGLVLFFPWARDLRLRITNYPNFDGVVIALALTFAIVISLFLFSLLRKFIKKSISYIAVVVAILLITLVIFFPRI